MPPTRHRADTSSIQVSAVGVLVVHGVVFMTSRFLGFSLVMLSLQEGRFHYRLR